MYILDKYRDFVGISLDSIIVEGSSSSGNLSNTLVPVWQMPPPQSPLVPPPPYEQTSEEKQIDKREVSFRLYHLSLFNKIDLNCYVFPPLSNDKLLLIIILLCAFFPSFISNTSIVSINFRANLDAQNAGNGISVFQISNIFWGSTPPHT
jgi:hypothetical protein